MNARVEVEANVSSRLTIIQQKATGREQVNERCGQTGGPVHCLNTEHSLRAVPGCSGEGGGSDGGSASREEKGAQPMGRGIRRF